MTTWSPLNSESLSQNFPEVECSLDSENYNLGCLLFEGYSPSNRHFLYSLYLLFSEIIFKILTPSTIFMSSIGIFISIFHFIVLSQKSMITSSTNIILLAIVFCDIFSLGTNIKALAVPYQLKGDKCTPPTSMFTFKTNIAIDSFLSIFRRTSTWLGVSLALIRWLSVKFFMISDRFTRPRTGILTVLAFFLVSGVFSTFSWTLVVVKSDKIWVVNETCTAAEKQESSRPILYLYSDDAIFGTGDTILTTFSFWNGFFSKLIPAVFLPILSALLLVELAKTKSTRSHASTAEGPRKDRTTALITLMTLTFLLSEGPLGVIIATQSFFLEESDPEGVEYLLTQFSLIWNFVFTVTASLHCFLCFGLSVQYRETAAEVFKNPCKKRNNRISDRSFSGAHSNSEHRRFQQSTS